MARSLLFALVYGFALAVDAVSANFQAGDEVKLTRDEPLFFRDQAFRDAKEGEILKALAYRPEQKKVFIAAKDKDGKDIALSVAEDAVTILPVNVDQVIERAYGATQHSQADEAAKIIASALTREPKDERLIKAQKALKEIAAATQRVASAKPAATRAEAEAERKLKNAAVADRPNMLIRGDSSNQRRAANIRNEAEKLEQKARDHVKESEEALKLALNDLESLRTPRKASKGGQLGTSGNDSSLTASFAKLWTDPFVEPIPVPIAEPSYQETVLFITGKLSWSDEKIEVGFGENSRLLLIKCANHQGAPKYVIAFDPADLTAEVKTFTQTRREPSGMVERGVVKLTCRNNQEKITMIPGPAFFGFTSSGNHYPTFDLVHSDRIDADKVGKAFSHLAQMFGAKADPF